MNRGFVAAEVTRRSGEYPPPDVGGKYPPPDVGGKYPPPDVGGYGGR